MDDDNRLLRTNAIIPTFHTFFNVFQNLAKHAHARIHVAFAFCIYFTVDSAYFIRKILTLMVLLESILN